MKKPFFIIATLVVGSFIFLSMTVLKSSIQEPWEVPAKYQKMENPYASTADAEGIGSALYSKHCKSCHGNTGKGDGPKAESVETPITDITTASFKEQTDGVLYYKTYIGRDDMPSFEKKITDEQEQWLLINYLRTLSD